MNKFLVSLVFSLSLASASVAAAVPKAAESPNAPVTVAPAQMAKPAAKSTGKEPKKTVVPGKKASKKAARKPGRKARR